VISSSEWGGARYAPFAFTEHGVIMAATILKSPQAIQATRMVVRTFVESRREIWEREISQKGRQLPLALDAPTRQGLMTKLSMALGHVLDAIVNEDEGATVRSEGKAVAAEGIKAIKAYLKKPGIENDRTFAEIRKIMAEAENIEVDAAKKKTENQHKQLALLAKKLRLVIQAQLYAESGSVEGLMAVLSDLEKG
jgi:L-alanine-DL-glutamate epimerase-like enolase superfamily enzyme